MKQQRDIEDGVSPVIGTILLVAITVVLVAIISAVVMGMTGGIGTSHVVGVKVVQGGSDTSVLVTITGGDTTGLTNLSVYSGTNELKNVTALQSPIVVGQPYNFTNTTALPSPASISVVGTFTDGDQTIYTGTINIV